MPSVGSFGRLQRRDRSGILGGDEHLLRERAWPVDPNAGERIQETRAVLRADVRQRLVDGSQRGLGYQA
jgi:hypothetical protein